MSDKPTKPQLKASKDIHDRQRGWDVGIPYSKAMATRLVNKGLCRYTAPFWGAKHFSSIKQKVSSVSLTTTGILYAEGRL